MCIHNKYYTVYQRIIKRALSRTTISGYIEIHHNVPKSLGGDNSQANLVKLTAREHFICHWLLTKCVEVGVEKMNYALWNMINVENQFQSRYKITSRIYENLKSSLVNTFRLQHQGIPKSAEHKQKISETRKRLISEGKLLVNQNKEKYKVISEKRKGYQHTEETKNKISTGNKGKIRSADHKRLISEIHSGKPWSEERKTKLSETMKLQYASGIRVPKKGARTNNSTKEN